MATPNRSQIIYDSIDKEFVLRGQDYTTHCILKWSAQSRISGMVILGWNKRR